LSGEKAEYLPGMAERVSGRYDEVKLCDGDKEIMCVHVNGQMRFSMNKFKVVVLHEGLKFVTLMRKRRAQKIIGVKGMVIKAEQLLLEYHFQSVVASAVLEYEYDTKSVRAFVDPASGLVSFVETGVVA
jgi:hypothetical protein